MIYSEKFKELPPEKTIRNIKEFFKSKNLTIRYSINKSCVGVWSSVVKIYFKNMKLLQTNGKGLSEDLCLASGLGEAYERFCSFFGNDMAILAKEKEKNIFNEILNEDSYKDNMLYGKAATELAEDGYAEMIKNRYKDIANDTFLNISNSADAIKINRKMLNYSVGSNGCACGNTFIEAFNQALSEICEREAMQNFLFTDEEYNLIEKENIASTKLQEIIKFYENNNKKIYIIDYSYNCDLPVVLVIMVDLNKNRFCLNFGCYPVFEIALERCLTELSQNTMFFDSDDLNKPYRLINSDILAINTYRNTNSCYQYNEEILFKIKTEKEINKTVFINADNSENVFDYWHQFIKQKDWKVYYRDYSLSDNICALRVYVPGLRSIFNTKSFYINIADENRFLIQKCFAKAQEIIKYIVFENNFEKFLECYHAYLSFPKKIQDIVQQNYYCGLSLFSLFHDLTSNGMFDVYIDNILKGEGYTGNNETFYALWYIKYAMLFDYIETKQYSKKEIINIGELYGFTYSDEHFLNYNNYEYLFKNIIYKNVKNTYTSDEYEEYIKIFKKAGQYGRI